jgi:hypothetical protein
MSAITKSTLRSAREAWARFIVLSDDFPIVIVQNWALELARKVK